MPTVSETLRALVQGREHRIASLAETIDALAEYFDLELQPKSKHKGRKAAGPKPRKPT